LSVRARGEERRGEERRKELLCDIAVVVWMCWANSAVADGWSEEEL